MLLCDINSSVTVSIYTLFINKNADIQGEIFMNSCINFSKKHPIILIVLTLAYVYGLLHLTDLLPSGPMKFAAIEWIMAVCVFIVAFLFMGKEKVSFSKKGFGYSFRSLRGYFIFMILFNAFAIFGAITLRMENGGEFHYQPIAFINVLVASFAIGIVEEFSFRGLIFGGLLQKLGNSKKNIILAAFLSGLLFGVMHVFESVITGGVTDMGSAATAVLKTVQTGVFGIALAFIYYKTRNIFAVAALHALDDFLLLFAGTFNGGERASYVTSNNAGTAVVAYIAFSLVVVPSIVRCIKNVKPEEAIPFDDDFLPRDVEFEKKSKKKTK